MSLIDKVDPDSIVIPEENNLLNSQGCSVFEKPITDQYISAELNLPQGNVMCNAKVVGRSKDGNWKTIVTYDENPFLNTIVYYAKFSDGEIKEYAANVVAQIIYPQVDTDSYRYQILDCITDH